MESGFYGNYSFNKGKYCFDKNENIFFNYKVIDILKKDKHMVLE